MNPQALALQLRAAAEVLERCRQLAAALPAGVVDADSAMTLAFDLPAVAHALYHIAGAIDPTGVAGDPWADLVPADLAGELVGQLGPCPGRAASC